MLFLGIHILTVLSGCIPWACSPHLGSYSKPSTWLSQP